MDPDLRTSMHQYYDERAPEYEEAYVLGTGTASIPDPDVFRREAALLTGIVDDPDFPHADAFVGADAVVPAR